MGKNILGIDIGTKNIAFALIKPEKTLKVMHTAIIPTQEDSIYYNGMINVSKMAGYIKEIISGNNMKVKELAFGIGCNQSVLREFKFQSVKSNEIDKAVELYIVQNFPGLDQTHNISYQIYDSPKEYIHGIVAACPKEVVSSYVELSKEIGIPLTSLDINANCIAKAYLSLVRKTEDKESVAIVNIGHKNSQVNIISNGKLIISRNVINGGADIDNLIARKINVSLEDAAVDKEKNNFLSYLRAGFDPDSYIREGYSDIKQEIIQTINYYNESGEGDKVKKVYLIGGGSNVVGLEAYLNEILEMPTVVMSPTDNNFFYVCDFSRLMIAIGATIRKG